MAEEAGFFEIGVALGLPLGLELPELFEVLLEGAMDALLVKRQQFERFGVVANGCGAGDGAVGFGVVGIIEVAGAVEVADRLLYACLARGLSFKVGGGNVVTLCPPLNISAEDLDRALEILGAAALDVERDLAGAT